MNQPTFRQYQGRNDIEKAQKYLLATRPAFKTLDRLAQIRQAGDFVRSELAVFAGQKGAAPAGAVAAITQERKAAAGGGALEMFRSVIDAPDFGQKFEAALSEDAEGTGKLLEGLAARVLAARTSKSGSPQVVAASFAAYPGRNDIEKAMAYLVEQKPGFKLNDRATQVRLASKFVRTGTLGDG